MLNVPRRTLLATALAASTMTARAAPSGVLRDSLDLSFGAVPLG